MKAPSAFLRRLREVPEFREEVRRIILTDELLALPAKVDHRFDQILIILQDLAVTQQRTQDQLEALAQRVDGLAQDVGELKGQGLEAEWRGDEALAVLGRWFRRLRVYRKGDLWDLLHDAADRGLLDPGEADEVAQADVVIEARDRRVVVEVSWTLHRADVQRARQRADLLARLGVPTVAVAAGRVAPEDGRAEARALGVWVIEDGRRVVGPEE